jgi:hypothetical protein
VGCKVVFPEPRRTHLATDMLQPAIRSAPKHDLQRPVGSRWSFALDQRLVCMVKRWRQLYFELDQPQPVDAVPFQSWFQNHVRLWRKPLGSLQSKATKRSPCANVRTPHPPTGLHRPAVSHPEGDFVKTGLVYPASRDPR